MESGTVLKPNAETALCSEQPRYSVVDCPVSMLPCLFSACNFLPFSLRQQTNKTVCQKSKIQVRGKSGQRGPLLPQTQLVRNMQMPRATPGEYLASYVTCKTAMAAHTYRHRLIFARCIIAYL